MGSLAVVREGVGCLTGRIRRRRSPATTMKGRSGSGMVGSRRRRARRRAGGRRWRSGGSERGSGEGVRGMCCGGALGAEARASWGSGALRCAGHGDGEVAAAELGWGGAARGGSSARGGGSRGSQGCHVRRQAKQEVAYGLPRWRRCRSAPAALKQRGREVEEGVWTSLQNPKISGVPR